MDDVPWCTIATWNATVVDSGKATDPSAVWLRAIGFLVFQAWSVMEWSSTVWVTKQWCYQRCWKFLQTLLRSLESWKKHFKALNFSQEISFAYLVCSFAHPFLNISVFVSPCTCFQTRWISHLYADKLLGRGMDRAGPDVGCPWVPMGAHFAMLGTDSSSLPFICITFPEGFHYLKIANDETLYGSSISSIPRMHGFGMFGEAKCRILWGQRCTPDQEGSGRWKWSWMMSCFFCNLWLCDDASSHSISVQKCKWAWRTYTEDWQQIPFQVSTEGKYVVPIIWAFHGTRFCSILS